MLSLLRAEKLELDKLQEYFDEIMEHYAIESLKQNPVEFRRKFAVLIEMWETDKLLNRVVPE